VIALSIVNVKEFMNILLIGETFDGFYVGESEITTFTQFKIGGRLSEDYFTSDELEALDRRTHCYWSEVKPMAFQLIKGKKLPVKFKIIFELSMKNREWLINHHHIQVPESDIGGLYLNIKYENKQVKCITGVSFNSFILDKSLEQMWDQTVQQFFKQKNIEFELV